MGIKEDILTESQEKSLRDKYDINDSYYKIFDDYVTINWKLPQ
ncbi:hypothetical protein [Clostridium sp. AWRP]|nr:hypothetical protein [Clostridium sp. AWRP]